LSQKKLKRNPKRSKSETYDTKEKSKSSKKYVSRKSWTSIWMIFIFIAVTGIIVIMILFTFTPKEIIVVEKNDIIELDYRIWTYENFQIDPYNSSLIFEEKYNATLKVYSRYEENATDGLILEFYNKILGESVGASETFNIGATVDIDKDGIDDTTEGDALGYGFPEDQLFNTSIVIYYKILAIQKSNNTGVLISIEQQLNKFQRT